MKSATLTTKLLFAVMCSLLCSCYLTPRLSKEGAAIPDDVSQWKIPVNQVRDGTPIRMNGFYFELIKKSSNHSYFFMRLSENGNCVGTAVSSPPGTSLKERIIAEAANNHHLSFSGKWWIPDHDDTLMIRWYYPGTDGYRFFDEKFLMIEKASSLRSIATRDLDTEKELKVKDPKDQGSLEFMEYDKIGSDMSPLDW